MLSDASVERPRTRPRRPGVAVVLSCCALVSIPTSAAMARPSHDRPTPGTPAPGEAGSSPFAKGGGKPEGSTGTEASRSRGKQRGPESADRQPNGAPSSPAQPDRSAEGAGVRESQDAARGQDGHEQQLTAHEREEDTASPASRRSDNKGRHGRSNERQRGNGGADERKGGEHEKGDDGANESKGGEHQKGDGGGTERQPGESKQAPKAPAPVAGAGPTAVSSTPAQATAASVTPSATTAPLVVGSAPEPGTPVRPGRAARQRTRDQGASRILPTVIAPRQRPFLGAIAAAPVPTTATKRASASVRRQSVHQSPLVRTVTRIVDVVPAAVRILIGALVAVGLALAVGSRLAALRARRLERQRLELLDDVGLLQGALLPVLPARLGPVGTSAAYRPAAGPGAGGDFYDVFALEDGQIAVIVGDVSGHGRSALPHTALVRFTLRAYLEAGMSPRSALQRAAAVLERQLGNSFATAVAATYQPREGVLVYACAGHPPPVVTGPPPIQPITVCSSPPMGTGRPTGMRQTVVSVPGGSLVCFYTDGVIESRVGRELFGQPRLVRALTELEPNATASALLDRVAEESDQRPDDMAACLLRIDGGAAAPSVKVEELELDRDEAAGDRAERFLLACGVDSGEAAEVMRSARAAAERTGKVLIELRVGDGPPEVVLRQDNVAFLDVPPRAMASAP